MSSIRLPSGRLRVDTFSLSHLLAVIRAFYLSIAVVFEMCVSLSVCTKRINCYDAMLHHDIISYINIVLDLYI